MITFLGVLFLLFLLILIAGLFTQHRFPLPTAAGAIIMSTGIIMSGGFQQTSFFSKSIGPYVAATLVILLFFIFFQYLRGGVSQEFRSRHVQHPVSSFATGTWVAATSVATVTLMKEVPSAKVFAFALFIFNIPLWVTYVFLVIRNYQYLWQKYANEVNGILLLACVATQSIALTGITLCGNQFLPNLWRGLVVIGITFYFIGMYFIIKRYLRKSMNLAVEWTNANCIIHGALSITGLTLCVGQFLTPNGLVAIWFVVFALLIIVESLEIVRLVQRVKRMGWDKGVFTYSITQWSRNFTFGMFDAFTFHLPFNQGFIRHYSFFQSIHHFFIFYWKYAVLVLFLLEVVLFSKDYLEKYIEKTKKIPEVQKD